MRSASSTRWLLSYEDLFVGAEALLVSNTDRHPWSDVLKISLGPEASNNLEKVQVIHSPEPLGLENQENLPDLLR